MTAPPYPATGLAPLPTARGPLSGAVLDRLRGDPAPLPAAGDADPWGEDLHLALHCCYELHYRGFAGVGDEYEWDVDLLGLRVALEERFLAALRSAVPASDDVAGTVDALLVEPVGPGAETGVTHHLLRRGERRELREYVVHRSIYHLKEADPQAWVIPRLPPAAKAGLVTVEHDEYGAGDAANMHAVLFAAMMRDLGLSDAYGAYVDAVGAETLAEVNFMSLCGLRRSLRGALVGQFALVELTSSPGSERLVRAMRRLSCGPVATRFYDEHVEADAVHEQVVRRDVLAPLLHAEPALAADVVFGIRAAAHLGERLGDRVLARWSAGESSLRTPLPGEPGR
ncbi:iron-containing redox enzyme family protein [Pseudonocardia sp. ICBG1293]|uniref:iron-containing redox enzyme family protein n=1 Tax=Pseudonocardia sp. ICBG1293 TaxID=2844382 RepID=UPI001CCCABAC|nr:iron-containing redox enzyme family protein [Pseudonocardia sp. ICBG1293]